MKAIVIFLFVWSFIGVYMDRTFLGIDLILSLNMLIVSCLLITYMDSHWWTLTLIVSIPNFLNELIPLLNITTNTTLLSTITTLLILVVAYLPNNLTKWNL